MYYLLSSFLFYDYTNTLLSRRSLVSLSPGERSSEIIGQKDSSQKRTRQQMNGGGDFC